MKDPIEPLDPAIFDQTVVEAYQRQPDECGGEREREFSSECYDVGRLDHTPSWHPSARIIQQNGNGALLTEIPDMAIPSIVFVREYDHDRCCNGKYLSRLSE